MSRCLDGYLFLWRGVGDMLLIQLIVELVVSVFFTWDVFTYGQEYKKF